MLPVLKKHFLFDCGWILIFSKPVSAIPSCPWLKGSIPEILQYFLPDRKRSLFLPFYWQPVSSDLLWVLVLMIICGASSQTLIVYSFSKATASTLAPFTYFEIVAAVAIGYFMFGTLPVWISWIGILLITISGLMVARSLPGRNPPQRQPKI